MTQQILERKSESKKILRLFCYLFFSCALNIHSINSALGNNDAAKPNNVESASEAAEAGNNAAAAAANASKDPYAATVSAALSSMNINAGSMGSGGAGGQASAVANASTMNNGAKDKTNQDVQKLQQQLNDIKEQVSFSFFFDVIRIL